MCISPVTVKNPRIDFRPSVDKLYLTVPCGHCAACRNQKRNDWFVRLYYQFKDTVKNGCVLFPTLTFSDDFLPRLSSEDSVHVKNGDFVRLGDYFTLPIENIPSFDKLTLRRSIKKLRTYLMRDHIILKDLKYFITCEFGSLPDKTHRQHYHCLFFSPDYIDSTVFKQYLEVSWSQKVGYIKKNGSYICSDPKFKPSFAVSAINYFSRSDSSEIFAPIGKDTVGFFCFHRNKNGGITIFRKRGYCSYSDENNISRPYVENEKAIKYVCKYIQKTDEYFHDIAIQRFADFISSQDINNITDKKRAVLDHIKGAFPFTLSSQGLGLPFLDNIEAAESFEDASAFIDSQVIPSKLSFPFTQKQYSVPRYLVDRLFNEHSSICRTDVVSPTCVAVNECDKITLNTLGLECLSKRLEIQVDHDVSLYRVLLSKDHYEQITSIPSSAVDGVDVKSLDFLFSMIPQNIDLELLSMYRIRFKDLSLYSYRYSGLDIPNFSKNDFVKLYYDLNFEFLDTFNNVSDSFDSPLARDGVMQQYLSLGVFNSLDIFHGFDYALEYMNLLSRFVSRCLHSATALSNEKRDLLINYLKSIKYV